MADERTRLLVDEALRCKTRILQNDGVVTSPCARPRRAGHTLLILGGQTFMCDKIYQVDHKAKEIIPKADLPSPRKEFSASAIGCKVYVTGGRGSENGVSKDVFIAALFIIAKTWKQPRCPFYALDHQLLFEILLSS